MKSTQYQQVTDRIIRMLEQGVRPWHQSWSAAAGGGRPRRADGQPYRGANVVNLWAAAMERGFTSSYWMTYKHAQSIGAQVRKGAKAELAFYVGTTTKTVERNGEEQDQTIPFLKAYSVFNCDEIDNLPPHFAAPVVQAVLADDERMPTVDTFIAMTGATVLHGGGRAFYRPSADEIRLPEFGSFDSASAYYGTALHELAHWSGAEKRLDRTKGKLFGDPDYAFEELVAELGAAFLCADLGVSSEPREDHASYLAGWLKALKADERAIFRAASFAEKAATFLHGFQVQDQVAA